MVMTKAPQPTLGNDTWRFIIGFKLCVCVFFILFFLLLLPDLSWFISRWKFMNRCFCAAFFVCSRPVVKGNKRGGLYYFLLYSAAAACSTTSWDSLRALDIARRTNCLYKYTQRRTLSRVLLLAAVCCKHTVGLVWCWCCCICLSVCL